MRTPPQQPAAGLIARLLAEPQRFEFFQAVRLLLLWLGEQGVPPRRALERHLRFRNSLALGFPAGQVEAIAPARVSTGGRRAAAIPPDPDLHGPAGRARRAARATSPSASPPGRPAEPDAQLAGGAARLPRHLHHPHAGAVLRRLAQVPHRACGGRRRDGFLPLLLALAGFAPGRRTRRWKTPPWRATPGCSGGVRPPPWCWPGCCPTISGCRWRCRKRSATGTCWPPASAALLGGVRNAVLGQAAVLGERCWRPDLRVRVRIGPLRRAQFERFLPRAAGAQALRTLLGLFAAPTLATRWCWCWRAANCARRAWPADRSAWDATAT
jgi:type VI secretion system protein ImpH